jgi:hypothetical protein
MAKTVLTYSWLVRKAMSLHRKDKAEYMKLIASEGTNKLIRGATVYWHGKDSSSCQYFELRDPTGGRKQARLFCNHRDGKAYTYYEMVFTTTTYRKRIIEKYMPITLPEGVRSKYNDKGGVTPCTFHNADGSVHSQAKWEGGGRNRRGQLEDDSSVLVIRDDNGQFVGDSSRLIDDLDLTNMYQDSVRIMGWFDAASRNRTEWLASIKALPEGFCDHRKMLKVAAEACLAAHKMVTKYPTMRMALFPAVPATGLNQAGSFESRLNAYRHSSDHTTMTVMARRPDGEAILYHLPEVLLYQVQQNGNENRVLRVSMLIPPHGNPSLDPTGKAGLSSKVFRQPKDARTRWDSVPVPDGLEQAYHSLPAWKPGSKATGNPSKHYDYYKFSEKFTGQMAEQDKELTIWPKHENKVVVWAGCAQSDELDCPLPTAVRFAMKPDDLAGRFEEQLLLASLPLC